MTHYLISEASRKLNVEAHVLRYWEEELELEIPRNELGHRYYTEKQLALFQRIKELKELGYQLKAIKTSLSAESKSDEKVDEAGFLSHGKFTILEGQTMVVKPEKTADKPEETADKLQETLLHTSAAERSKGTGRLERLSERLSARASGNMTEAVLEKMTGKLAESMAQETEIKSDLPFEEIFTESVENPDMGLAETETSEKEPPEIKISDKETESDEMAKEQEEKTTVQKPTAETDSQITALEMTGQEGLTASPEKMQQFQTIMTDILAEALRRNQDTLSREVGGKVSEKVVKEMNYLMRDREEREEERYRKLDETIRACQRVQKQKNEAAATRVPVRGMKKSRFPWGRRKDSLIYTCPAPVLSSVHVYFSDDRTGAGQINLRLDYTENETLEPDFSGAAIWPDSV